MQGNAYQPSSLGFGPVWTGSPGLGPPLNLELDFGSGSAPMLNLGLDLGLVHKGSGLDQSLEPNCGIPTAYSQPDELLDRVSLMPQLEILWIGFDLMYSGHYIDLGMMHMDNATHISLPNLRFFQFGGFHIYL